MNNRPGLIDEYVAPPPRRVWPTDHIPAPPRQKVSLQGRPTTRPAIFASL